MDAWLWLGGLLILVSLLTRAFIAGAEFEARRTAARTSAEKIARALGTKQQELEHPMSGGTRYLFLQTDPPGAAISGQASEDPGRPSLQPFLDKAPTTTPTFVRDDWSAPLTLETPFRRATLLLSQAHGVAELALRPAFLVLTSLFLPGLALVGFSVYRTSSRQTAPQEIPTSRSFLAPASLESAPGRSHLLSAPFEHSPDTPEELRYGRFIKGELVGQGAMGRVYRSSSCLAADTNEYALKVLLPEWSRNPDFRARFEREADICHKLVHPNLVRAFERGEKGEDLWMVMEFLQGQEWQDWLESEQPSQEEILRLFEGLCEGLAHAHSQGVVHRDLKPENILVASGRAVVTDFGLAKSKQYATITKTNTAMGTPIYMPPEQVTGGQGSPQGDIYSLGCVLYQSLSGEIPFPETDVLQLLTQKLNGGGPRPLDPEKVDPALAEIIRKMMADNPLDRYRTAHEVREALQAFRSRST